MLTAADLAYVRTNYLTLDELCAGRGETPATVRRLIERGLLPRPSYVLDDGTEMFPADYPGWRSRQVGRRPCPLTSRSGFARPVTKTSRRSGRAT